MSYLLGQTITLYETFTNEDGDPADPDVIGMTLAAPDGTVSALTFPATIGRTGVGVYTATITLNRAGAWVYVWAVSGGPDTTAGGSLFVVAAPPTWSYDPRTAVGRVRLMVPDRIEAEALFTDQELAAFIDIEGDSLKQATALALEAIASDEALVQKATKLMDLQTDGPSVAKVLLARAAMLRQQALQEDDDQGGGFDWAELVTDDFAARERLYDQYLRRRIG